VTGYAHSDISKKPKQIHPEASVTPILKGHARVAQM
jgi:hypothetical protein